MNLFPTSHERSGPAAAPDRDLRYDARTGRMLRLEEARSAEGGWRRAWVDATDGFWPLATLEAIESSGGSPSARVTRAGLALVRQAQAEAARPGRTPLVALAETVPVLITVGERTVLVQQPVFEIVGWIAEAPR